MIRAQLRRSVVPLLAALGMLSACTAGDLSAPVDRSPTAASLAVRDAAPASDGARGGKNGAPASSAPGRTPHAATCTSRDPIVNSGVFGPSGGTLVVGSSRLIIPGGALRDTVTITATAVGGASSEIDFQPEGLQFSKPAGLVLDGTGCSLEEALDPPSVVWLAPDGTILETIPAFYDPHWKAVAAPIGHFSGYAIAF